MTSHGARRLQFNKLQRDIEQKNREIEQLAAAQDAVVLAEITARYGVTVGSRIAVYGGSSRTVEELYVVENFETWGWPMPGSLPRARACKVLANGKVSAMVRNLYHWHKPKETT